MNLTVCGADVGLAAADRGAAADCRAAGAGGPQGLTGCRSAAGGRERMQCTVVRTGEHHATCHRPA